MDPIVNLRDQREVSRAIIAEFDRATREGDGIDRDHITDLAEQLADLVLALDDWRLRGGFDPYGAARV